MTYRFYRFPDLDARIGLALDGRRLAVTFLAAGCLRTGEPGAYEYARRNPDKRTAQARWIEAVTSPWIPPAAGVRWGATGNPIEEVTQ